MSSHGFAHDTTKREDGMKILVRGERGAATVEFAIIAIVLLAIVFGIIEFGILMFDEHILTNASREGARTGVVMQVPRIPDRAIDIGAPDCPYDHFRVLPDDTCIPAGVIDIVEWYALENLVSVGAPSVPITTVTRPWAEETPPRLPQFGEELTVTVTYPFDFLFLSFFGLGPIPLKAETRMRME